MGARRLLALGTLQTVRSWMSSSTSNDGLVSHLVRDGVVTTPAVEAALRRLDRKHFARALGARAPPEDRTAYADAPAPIGPMATISAPHMHGRCLELLAEPLLRKTSARVLDVGSGSGYLTAAFALLGGGVRAFGVDRTAALVDLASENLRRDRSLADALGDRVSFEQRDGWTGLPAHGPYDAIHVGAAADSVPAALLDQLAAGGRMVIPVGGRSEPQALVQIDKTAAGELVQKTLFGVRYVELVDERNLSGKEDL